MMNIKKHSLLTGLIIIVLSLSYLIKKSNSLEIVLDDQNPIQFIYPNSNQITKIDLRFYFVENSQGLTYGQYIGVAFPASLASELSFDKGSAPKFNCLLTETSNGKSYKFIAEKPSASEANYIYCKLDDRINNTLKSGPKFFYKFTIELTGIKIYSTNFIRNFMIFTSTSNDPNKIIIDHSMSFGTLNIYSSWEDSKTKPFELIGQNIFQGNNALLNIFPYMTFDISLNLKTNIFINSSEINLMIKFPNEMLSAAQSIISTGDATNPALKGSLKRTVLSNNFLLIEGIEEDFVPGKQFNLSLKGFTALDKNLNAAKPLEIFVFYKNTYSVLSYAKTSNSFLRINSAKVQLAANHPESWDIWRNALWPMSFKITNGPNALVNGGFIVLQHSNAVDYEIKWNFAAATCDFSDSENFDNSLGKRPVCFPLRTDFEYANSSGAAYPGSAIFFKVNSLSANQVINLTVWGSADNCGGNNLDNLSSAIKPNFSFRQFNYKVSVYSSINQFESFENRFVGSNISLLAQSDEITMANKCYNNVINGIDFTVKPIVNAAGGVGRVFDNDTFLKRNIKFNKDDANKKALSDINLFREFYNFEISSETVSSLPCDSCHLKDITTSSNKFNTAFIYGTKSVNSVNSYFSARLPILHYTKDNKGNKIAANKAFPAEYLPVNFAYDSNGIAGSFPGRLQFLFSKNWFTIGNNPSCYVSWGMHSPDVAAINKDKSLLVDDTTGTNNGKKNWITSNTSNPQAWIDSANSCLFGNAACSMVKILSKHHTGEVATSNQFNNFSDIATNLFDNSKSDNFFTFYVYYYSSCVKWATLPKIKSLYTYIDFQVQWLYSDDATKIGTPNRNLRMVKLFPEAGVFNDNITDDLKFLSTMIAPLRPTQVNDKTYYLHYSLGSSASKTGICLIEVSAKSVMDLMTKTTTHLGIWIGFGVILESDYTDLAMNYPITPINPLVNGSFGFQSAYLLNAQESMLQEFYYNSLDTAKNLFPDDNDGANNYSVFSRMLANYAKTGKSAWPTLYDFNPKDAANHAKNTFRNFSSYYFLMGSFILIAQNKETPMISMVGQETQLRNILIPIYCPIHYEKVKFRNGLPTLFISTINMTAYNNISNIEKIMSVNLNNTEAKDDKALFSVIITTANSSNPVLYRDPDTSFTEANSLNSTLSNAKKNLINIRWASYTAISPENLDSYLYLYLGTKDISNATAGFCTGHVFLLHNSIDVDASILKTGFTGTVNYYPKTKKFYYLGKEFLHMIAIGLQNESYPSANNMVTSANALTAETSPMYVIGVKRPVISYYYVNNKFTHAYDKIGYFCSDLKSKENYTNFLNNENITTKIFIVDYNFPSTAGSAKFTITLSSDKPETIYRNDVAANIRITGTNPANANLPAGSAINFSFTGTVLNSASICGLSDSENIASECSYANSTVSCVAPRSLNTFTICCYNVSYLGIITSDLIVLSGLSVTVPAYPLMSSFTDFYADKIFNEPNPTRFTWLSSHSSAQDLVSFFPASITNVKYTHVIQDSGIGKVNFTVALPREPTRNMAITFYADLSSAFIPNSNPICNASFGFGMGYAPENSGYVLIDNCTVANLGNSINAIRITTKNIIYKCGLSFSKILNVFVWPILTINFTTSPFNSLSFRILMNLNNEFSDSIAQNSFSFTIKDEQKYAAKPLIMSQWDVLCPVESIDPRIPGELADYVFEVDVDSYRVSLANNTPNEMSIFFPFNFYGANFENINCYYIVTNQNLNCGFTLHGILNIRLPINLQIGSGKKLQIKVTGIVNPSVDVNTSVYFPCTLNKTDFSSNSRFNLITGSGKLSGGITLPTAIGSIGNLRYLLVKNPITDLNPRTISTLTIKIGFDLIGDLNVLPIKISNNPRIVVNLPAEFKLAWFDNSKISATIDEYNSDDKNIMTKTATLTPKFILQSGNKLTIILDAERYTFKTDFQYWELKITNLFNPPEDTSEDFIPLSLGSRLLNVLFTNSDFSSVFKTHTNTNNFISKNLENQLDPWLTNYKGFLYNFDNKKWIIDIGSKTQPNYISVRAGRYITSFFSLRNNSNLYAQSNVISLIDSTFKLYQQSYSVNTASSDPTPFMIGAPCGSQMGNYLLYFKSTDTTNFFALSPVIVSLTNSVMGSISYLNPPTIPAAGSTLVYFYISESNFDQLNFEFINDENFKNDPTAEITNVQVPAATITDSAKQSTIFGKFKIKNNQVLYAQVFKLTNPNACYAWVQKSLTIYISGSISVFPKNLSIAESFKYFNYESETSLPGKNAIKFSFSPAIVPAYFSCALVCSDSLFPADESIRDSIGVESPLLKFFKAMITKSTKIDFVFDNLVRGLKYKLRCLNDSIEGEITQRNSVAFVMDSYKKDDGSTVPIQTLPQIKPQCVQYVFANEPKQSLKNAMMNYCQSIFMASGNWSGNGCVVCTDSSISVLPSGFNLPKSLACTDMNTKANLSKDIYLNPNFRLLQQSGEKLDSINYSSDDDDDDDEKNKIHLKFLAQEKIDLIKFKSEQERILQINNSTNINTNSVVNPVPINPDNTASEKIYYSYSICPVPYQICPSDISGAKSYNDYFNTLKSSFDSDDSIRKNANITDPSLSLYKTLIIKDEGKPDLSKISFAITYKNINGLVKWKSTHTSALNCYWEISDFTANFDGNSIIKCSDYSYCGSFRITVVPSTSSTNIKFLQPLNQNYDYGLFVVCLNDVPYASLQSDVVKFKFVVDSQDSNLNVDSSDVENQPAGNNVGNYIEFNYLFILCILFLV